MNEAILWAIIWFVAIPVGEVIAYAVTFGLFVLLAAWLDQEWIAVVGAILGWVSMAGWFVFAGYHFVIEVVTLLQLIF